MVNLTDKAAGKGNAMTHRAPNARRRGAASLLAIYFVFLFAALSISFAALSTTNVSLAANHRNIAAAQAAAESGLQFACALIADYCPPSQAYTPLNSVSDEQARNTFAWFADQVQQRLDFSPILAGAPIGRDDEHDALIIPFANFDSDTQAAFALEFRLLLADQADPHRILVISTGRQADTTRACALAFPVQKDGEVLEYAIASRGRMWVVGDSTIHGSIFSTWNRPEVSPFVLAAQSTVEGSINTVLARADMESHAYKLETLDEHGKPMFDEHGKRIKEPKDKVQGDHQGINYQTADSQMPGMDISDYDTSVYADSISPIPYTSTRRREYFPHAAGSYSTPASSSSRRVDRYVYENQHFTNAALPANRNALFRNCTFDGILYIDAAQSASYYYNNVRFQDCTFNGTIVTNTPQALKWQHNCLYFTGSATFQNQTMTQATILAPHFNVNLGNTNPIGSEHNVLRGAIVGGIVDVRGNAEVLGTIISMADTTAYTSGYVTNIGATNEDGGSETTEPGDIGTIDITPDPENMLPSGIVTPIVIDRLPNSYIEL